MENPLTWTPAHHAISKAIDAYEQMRRDDPEVVGPSLVSAIYERLFREGHLKDESRIPAYSTWEELREARGA